MVMKKNLKICHVSAKFQRPERGFGEAPCAQALGVAHMLPCASTPEHFPLSYLLPIKDTFNFFSLQHAMQCILGI